MMDEREKKLGFRPQKESIYNSLLPYTDKLDEESQRYLLEIKTNLQKAILSHDLRSISTWIDHLNAYIRLYDRKFSKDDHVHFIKLLFELLTIPDVQLVFVKQVAGVIHLLLKKVHLLSRDDLQLPWRPLYELYERIFFSSYETYGMVLLPENLNNQMKILIKSCNLYFSVESTQEILDEFKPLLCPFDSEMAKAVNYFELFLCTSLPPEEHHKGFKLWFEEFMGLWQSWHNIPTWENTLLFLFARLAKDNIGYIDWEPYIPMIFTRWLRSFNLPGRSSTIQVVRVIATFDTTGVSDLISSILGNGSSCQHHLNQLFKSLESFYHPSNYGRWLARLLRLLQKLPIAVTKRLHRERHQKPSWKTPIPEKSKLTDQEITDFVNSLVPATLLSIFSKRGCSDSAIAFQNLGALRPELVIPPLLERLYSSLESLTEPHRLTAAMHCIVPVCRPMVQKSKYYPEGPSHVIPLLMAALPGIDPNDIKKSMVTFQFISTVATLVTFIDSSAAVNHNELPENVQELCIASAAFEDFVLQFMDRIFVMIVNSCLDNTSRLDRESEQTNVEETILGRGLYGSFGNMMMQSSPAIYKTALSKLRTFVTNHILEISVSGKFAGNLCRVMCMVNPELGLETFLPHFSKLVLTLMSSDDILSEEKLDDELLFSLLILSEVVGCPGNCLLKYQDVIIKVLERALRLRNKKGYILGCAFLKHALKGYVLSFIRENRSTPDTWSRYTEVESHHYFDDWGTPGDIHNLGLQWHIPSNEEIEAAKQLLEMFLVPEVENLRKWAHKEITLEREEVLRSLHIISSCVTGGSVALPMWEEENLAVRETSVPLYRAVVLECGAKEITFHGKNVRHYVAEVLREVLSHILENNEDDTKALFLIISLYYSLMYNWGNRNDEVENRKKTFGLIKRAIEDKLHGQKKHIRTLLIDRTFLQHEFRVSDRYRTFFSATHQLILKDLLTLSTSHYSEVRKRAQNVLQASLIYNKSSYKVLIPGILECLQKDPMSYHEEFKGVLHVIIGQKNINLLKVQDWDTLSKLMPALVSSKHSEKPSIVKLLDSVSSWTQKHFPTHQIRFTVPEKCLAVAKTLCQCDSPIILSNALNNDVQERRYLELVNSLINLMENGSLHWRHYQLALTFLAVSVRPDVMFPKEGVRIFVNHMVHDTITIRKLAIQGVTCVLKQQKRKHPKVEIDPSLQNSRSLVLHPVLAKVEGEVPDNFWLQYNSADPPDTEEKWNSRHFVHQTHWGFHSWPKSFKVHAPDSEQPKLDRKYEELTEEEKPIYEAFTQQTFVDNIVRYLSLEEKKGQDKFDPKKYFLFKNIFNAYGDTFLPYFMDHLQRLTTDKQESMQRCAAEIMAGIFAACKHWDFQKVHRLKDQLIPILEKLMYNITTETIQDWATCIAAVSESRDPNKYYWIFEFFMKEPQSVENGSFLESSWLNLLTNLVAQQEWRACELLHRSLEHILPKLDHSYQNVREKLGSLLAYIFMYDIPINGKNLPYTPKRAAFLESLMPRFAILEASRAGEEGASSAPSEESPELKNAKNLFRTISRWVTLNGSKTLLTAPPDILALLPLLCHMANDTTDTTFQQECKVTIAILSHAFLDSTGTQSCLKTLRSIICSNSWHSRIQAANFLQTMVFSNLFTVMGNEEWTEDVKDLILNLLQDEHVEVRDAAAETLCGFLHCELLKVTDKLIDFFKSKSQKKMKRKPSASGNGLNTYAPDEVRERHVGILGLCACVNAYPYDVPAFIPDILVLLADHLHDPPPISGTIKKSLSSFRRTHLDNWHNDKLKFTEDQLSVISDLLVSPSYYA